MKTIEIGAIADTMLARFRLECEMEDPEDARIALEQLVGKAARMIERYNGHQEAINVLRRTLCHLQGGSVQ